MKIPNNLKIEVACLSKKGKYNALPLQHPYLKKGKKGFALIATDGYIMVVQPVKGKADLNTEGYVNVDAIIDDRKIAKKEKRDVIVGCKKPDVVAIKSGAKYPRAQEKHCNMSTIYDNRKQIKPGRTVTINVDYLKRLADALGSNKLRLQLGEKTTDMILVRPYWEHREMPPENPGWGFLMPWRVSADVDKEKAMAEKKSKKVGEK